MKTSNVDLHMHSTVSDGTDRPEELIARVKEAGIRTFSLTDHDTVSGALKVEQLLGEDPDPDKPEFFRGVEFSCRAGSTDESSFKCHILGYQYDPQNEHFRNALAMDHDLRIRKTESRLEYLKAQGMTFTDRQLEDLRKMESPGKLHLADLLAANGYARDRAEGLGMIHCNVKMETRIPARMALRGIVGSGGIGVWAHPLGGEGETHIGRTEFFRRLHYLMGKGLREKEQGENAPVIRGLECWYSRYSKDEIRFLLEAAEEFGLFVSGGSDYHGSHKDIGLGTLNDYGKGITDKDLSIVKALRKIRKGKKV